MLKRVCACNVRLEICNYPTDDDHAAASDGIKHDTAMALTFAVIIVMVRTI